MIKKMIYLNDDMARGLERVAAAERKSVSAVVRDAVDRLLKSAEYHDLVLYDQRMAEYLGKPSIAVPFRDVMDD